MAALARDCCSASETREPQFMQKTLSSGIGVEQNVHSTIQHPQPVTPGRIQPDAVGVASPVDPDPW